MKTYQKLIGDGKLPNKYWVFHYDEKATRKDGERRFKMEIYFSDLTEEAQKSFLAWEEMADPKEGNYDVFPIGIVGTIE